jgi:hypothetical protein
MEAMLGISLYNYLYLKLAKTLSNKIGEQEGGTGSTWKWAVWGKRGGEEGDGPNNVYTCE